MSKITREQLRERAREKVKSLQFSVTQSAFAGSRAELEEELELARIALASLEAEAVAYVDPIAFNNFSVYRAGETDNKRMGREWMWANPGAGLIPVYTAPPTPVVPEEMPKGLAGQIVSLLAHNIGDKFLAQKIWNACRAAMLQGAEPVTTAYKLPEGWVAVPVEPTKEMIDAGWSYYMTTKSPSSLGVYGAMLAAAPQQEVKP